MATITEISPEKDEDGFCKFVFVKPDKYVGVPYPLRADIPLVPKKRLHFDRVTRKAVQRKTYWFRLAHASTVHKAQVRISLH